MPPGDGPQLHPHIFAPRAATSQAFTSPKSARSTINVPPRGRGEHAGHLLGQLRAVEPVAVARAEAQQEAGLEDGNGIYLVFQSTPDFDLKFESLDYSPSGIELCLVRKVGENQVEATVWIPDGKLAYFLKKITAYRDENTKPAKSTGLTRPKNEDFVTSIANIQLAVLQALWSDSPELYPAPDADATFEVWLRSSAKIDHLARLREHAARFNLRVSSYHIPFMDRTIVLVHGKGRDLAASNELLGAIAEVRLAKTTAEFFTGMGAIQQQDWVDNLAGRITLPPEGSPYVCLLDTGLNRAHPLIEPLANAADLHTYKPAWGTADRHGHGTPMAGLAIYGDLIDPLSSGAAVILTHRVESVKLFNTYDPHEKELFGAVTSESINRAEVTAERQRVFCLSITASDDRDRGRPSSWSAALDSLASGFVDGQRRLIIVSAGNTLNNARGNYPDSNLTDAVHDPGQSWNALTVGGYTEKAEIDQRINPGWQPLAGAGDLSPCSCTSVTWQGTKWPIKPDIVMEAGNMARHADHATPDYLDAIQLLSTPHDFNRAPLVSFGDTSAAAALASRLAAMLWAKYPTLTPEAVRALIVHSSDWTDPMLARATEGGQLNKDLLVRCFGFGTPNVRKLLSSADNSLTLIAQGSIQPFHKDGTDVKTREMKLHELPWPREALEALGPVDCTMRVTLSYFVEPNPGERGWSTKYGYQSHGLRFDVKRATESIAEFQARVNRNVEARDIDYDPDEAHKETGTWFFGGNSPLSALGSLRCNAWTGRAADLAARGNIAVYPTYGWWNKRPNLKGYEKATHYALVATISTPETDIYTSVANSIGIPILVET